MDKKLSKQILLDKNVRIDNSSLGNFIWIRTGTTINNSFIGDDVFIGFRCKVNNSNIGNYVQIASKSKIGGGLKTTKIEDFCWIGANVSIADGVTIGRGSVIGANSVVKEDIPPDTIAYGTGLLVKKTRMYIKDSVPDFRSALKSNLAKQVLGEYLSADKNGNSISAHIICEHDYQIGFNNILIGDESTGGYIQLGNNVSISNGCIFEGAGRIIVGNNSQIGNNVHIVSNSHDYSQQSLPMIYQPVKIGSNVVIDDNCLILGGVSISDNSFISSNNFILKNV
ncbi:DapH/DapD/GlmU-related protein [Enterococcus sp. AZ163]|uniref:DapH/DapD/GlmU-related protein n=1 Tax=Enterococcus sp. AZ163 TaxID=2774638 RepID=UPI003D2D5A76